MKYTGLLLPLTLFSGISLAQQPVTRGICNAASAALCSTFDATGKIVEDPAHAVQLTPGEIISIFGDNLGPTTALTTTLDSTGKVSTALGSVHVTVNGLASPLLYVSAKQINAVIPYSICRDSVNQWGPVKCLNLDRKSVV